MPSCFHSLFCDVPSLTMFPLFISCPSLFHIYHRCMFYYGHIRLPCSCDVKECLKRHSPRRKILPKPKKLEENSLITRFYHSRNYGAIYWSVLNLSLLCREARIAHAVQISWPQTSVCAAVVQVIGVVVCSSSSNLTENKLAAIGLYTRVCSHRRARLI